MTIECSFLTQRHGHCTNKTRLREGCVVEGGRDLKPSKLHKRKALEKNNSMKKSRTET